MGRWGLLCRFAEEDVELNVAQLGLSLLSSLFSLAAYPGATFLPESAVSSVTVPGAERFHGREAAPSLWRGSCTETNRPSNFHTIDLPIPATSIQTRRQINPSSRERDRGGFRTPLLWANSHRHSQTGGCRSCTWGYHIADSALNITAGAAVILHRMAARSRPAGLKLGCRATQYRPGPSWDRNDRNGSFFI